MAEHWIARQTVDLVRGSVDPRRWVGMLLGPTDDKALEWILTVTRAGQPADLEGCVAAGYFLRPDGVAVRVAGEIAGNVITIVPGRSCYTVPGELAAQVRLGWADGSSMELAEGLFYVGPDETGDPIQDGDAIPSLEALAAKLEEMEEAAEAAQAAAQSAAQDAASAAGSATDAETSKNAAGIYAGQASDSAGQAASSEHAAEMQAEAAHYDASQAASSATAAAASAAAAATSETNAAASADAAQAVKDSIPEDYTALSNDVKEALSFKGAIPDDNVSDIDAITDYGMYAIKSTALNIPIAAMGTLLVMPVGYTDSSTGLYRYRKIQVFFTDTAAGEKNVCMRYMANSTTWSANWTRLIDYGIYDTLSDIQTKALAPSGFTSASFEQGGISESGGNSTNSKRIRTKGYVDVRGHKSIHYAVDDGYRMYVVFFSRNASGNNLMPTGWLTGSGTLIFPAGTNYYRAALASVGDATALTIDDYAVADIQYGTALVDTYNPIVEQTKWLAMGDSITYGIYSTGPNTEVTNKNGWVQRLAASLGYDLTTMASRGMGYTVTGQDPLSSSSPRINLATLVSRAVDLSATQTFNLITLAFGVNDYNTVSSTLAGVQASLSDTITSLMAAYPEARLAVITPLNCTTEGTAATKYAYGAAHGSYTMAELAAAIKQTCESFGVECINATDGFLLNTQNITTLLPDGVHPSYRAHTLIAKNMAHYLLD